MQSTLSVLDRVLSYYLRQRVQTLMSEGSRASTAAPNFGAKIPPHIKEKLQVG